MKSHIAKSLLFLVGFSTLGVMVMSLYLPFMPGGIVAAIVGMFIQLVMVMIGGITTILMGKVFPPPIVFEVVIGLGVLSIGLFSCGLKCRSLKLSFTSLVIWVFVGSWSTFWGIAYGI